MSPTYWKRRKLRLHERAMRGVAAREKKRMAETAAMQDVGGFFTDGCLGEHTVRLLAYADDSRRLGIMMDGTHRTARTARGVLRILAGAIWSAGTQPRTKNLSTKNASVHAN